MPRKKTTYNRTNPNTETPSQRKARREARADGRESNAAYTSGARTVSGFTNDRGYRISDHLDGLQIKSILFFHSSYSMFSSSLVV